VEEVGAERAEDAAVARIGGVGLERGVGGNACVVVGCVAAEEEWREREQRNEW
jgi:hypothetical protein